MPHPTHLLPLVVALATSQAALAADQTDWSPGVASIGITSATPAVHVTVTNVSPAVSVAGRELAVVSSPPALQLKGQVFCKPILGGSTRVASAQVMFGQPFVSAAPVGGTTVNTFGVRDATTKQVFGGGASATDVSFAHHLDFPSTWNGGIALGFNPVKVVEDNLATYVSNGGSAADFLRQDAVFEVQIGVNLVGVCQNTSSYGVHAYAGITRRWITAHVFYVGDPDIKDPIVPAIPTPQGITKNPSLPPKLLVHAPFPPPAPPDRGDDGADEDGGGDREVSFERFPIWDVDASAYDGVWSGWVTYDDPSCSDTPRRAVTPTGECVEVDSCMPEEFDSCRLLDGCCDAGPVAPVR